MSTAYKNRKKAMRRAAREAKGNELGNLQNQIRRGVVPRFTWARGSKKLVPIGKDGKAIQRKPRQGAAKFSFTKRWKQYSVTRTGPRILGSIAMILGGKR